MSEQEQSLQPKPEAPNLMNQVLKGIGKIATLNGLPGRVKKSAESLTGAGAAQNVAEQIERELADASQIDDLELRLDGADIELERRRSDVRTRAHDFLLESLLYGHNIGGGVDLTRKQLTEAILELPEGESLETVGLTDPELSVLRRHYKPDDYEK